MSSLLAYGQGFLSGDIWSGAGLSEPWAQSFGWGDGDDSSVNQEECTDTSEGGGLAQFFKEIQAGAPQDVQDSPQESNPISSTKQELHWDSPPQSPSTVFVHLPYSVLQILSTGTKADAVVVGFFQTGSENIVDTLLVLPKRLNFADTVVFQADMLTSINGKIVCTDKLNLPSDISIALGGRPQAFLAQFFSLEKYKGVIFGVWRDGSHVPATAEAAFSDAVQALPMLLSNRINVKKYERIGRRFDAILKVMPDAVVFIDDQETQVTINPAAAMLLGLSTFGEVDTNQVALAMRKLTDRCSSRTDPQHCMKLLSSSEEMEIEEDWELKMPRRVLHVRSYPVTSHSAHGRLWIYEDVTAERDAEQAIEAANKAKSQFLAMMSHELRTPMTGVLGMLDLLHLTNLGLEQQDLVQIMQESAEGLMEVINNILDFCKIEAGRLQLEEIDFPLSDMFEQVENMLKKHILKKDLKVTISGEPGGRNVVRGDPVRLRQVVLNLVSNAIKFTEHGSVSVSWRFLDPQWVDTTVVATSQSAPAKSKLINQIINASREKCSVEHLTTPNGRSIIIVHCSSEGVAGPYLESSITNSRSAGLPSQSSNQTHQSISSMNTSASELATHRTGRPSFPVSYSVQPQKRPASECLSIETRHSFNERKSIVGKDTVREQCDEVAQPHGRELQDGQLTPSSEKSVVLDPSSNSKGTEFGPRKHQRLSAENHNRLQGSSVIENHFPCKPDEKLGILECPKLLSVSDAESYGAWKSSSVSGRDNAVIKSQEKYTGSQRIGSFPSGATTSSKATGEKLMGTMDPSVARKSGDSSGLQFCNVGEVVRNTENSVVGTENSVVEYRKEVKPEDKVWLEVTIADTGVGIGKEQLDRLFVGSHAGSQRRNAAGTGLGLAICKGLLCLMEGKMQFDSKIGEGTTVILTVPLLPAEEGVQVLMESASLSAQPTTSPEPLPSKNLVKESKATDSECKQIKVLVAEDNKVNQLLIRKMFQHFGHEVEVVGNGKLAVEAVQRNAFDLILMDVQMPILDGLSATKAIRALPPPASNIPIYALSADNPGSGPLEETGLDGYLKKPIAWEMICNVVAQILVANNEL